MSVENGDSQQGQKNTTPQGGVVFFAVQLRALTDKPARYGSIVARTKLKNKPHNKQGNICKNRHDQYGCFYILSCLKGSDSTYFFCLFLLFHIIMLA